MNDPYKIKRTPLRYPGGKARAMSFVYAEQNMPGVPIKEYREPFLGGGSPAIAFAKRYPNVPVWVNDKYYNLYCFWKSLRDHGEEMHELIWHLRDEHDTAPSARKLYEKIRDDINDQKDEFEIAWRFYIINRCSFSGLTESSTFSDGSYEGNWTPGLVDGLLIYSRMIRNWKITNLDYTELLSDDPETFVFLDPPYDLKNDYGLSGDGEGLYGKRGTLHRGFNHVEFAENLNKHKSMMMVTYNSNENIRNLFEGWDQVEWDLTYSMRADISEYGEDQKNRKELLCTNYSIGSSTLEDFF